MTDVDVIMVTHNGGHFLAEAVRSILEQSHAALRLIVVDNASSDGSVHAAKSALADKRVLWCAAPENRGAYGGFKVGFARSTAPYVARMDADDIAWPHRLALQFASLEADSTLDAVGSAAMTIDANGVSLDQLIPSYGMAQELHVRTAVEMPLVHPTLFARRSVFEKEGYRYAFPVAADFDLVSRLADRRAVANLPLVLLSYRRHASALSSSHRPLQIAMACAVRMATARRRRGEPERIEELTTFAGAVADASTSERRILSAFANRCRREGEHRLAVWHARQALAAAANEGEVWAQAPRTVKHALQRALKRRLP